MDTDDDDFKRFSKKAHLQILLLHWSSSRLAERQQQGKTAVDAIEQDFKDHCDQHNQTADF